MSVSTAPFPGRTASSVSRETGVRHFRSQKIDLANFSLPLRGDDWVLETGSTKEKVWLRYDFPAQYRKDYGTALGSVEAAQHSKIFSRTVAEGLIAQPAWFGLGGKELQLSGELVVGHACREVSSNLDHLRALSSTREVEISLYHKTLVLKLSKGRYRITSIDPFLSPQCQKVMQAGSYPVLKGFLDFLAKEPPEILLWKRPPHTYLDCEDFVKSIFNEVNEGRSLYLKPDNSFGGFGILKLSKEKGRYIVEAAEKFGKYVFQEAIKSCTHVRDIELCFEVKKNRFSFSSPNLFVEALDRYLIGGRFRKSQYFDPDWLAESPIPFIPVQGRPIEFRLLFSVPVNKNLSAGAPQYLGGYGKQGANGLVANITQGGKSWTLEDGLALVNKTIKTSAFTSEKVISEAAKFTEQYYKRIASGAYGLTLGAAKKHTVNGAIIVGVDVMPILSAVRGATLALVEIQENMEGVRPLGTLGLQRSDPEAHRALLKEHSSLDFIAAQRREIYSYLLSSFSLPPIKVLSQVFENMVKEVAFEWIGEPFYRAKYKLARRLAGLPPK